MAELEKVYLIGLDGFNRGLFQYLEERGVMPTLSSLAGEGSGGRLRSTRPPYTGPAWVSMFTGVNPGRHGIYGFTRRRAQSYRSRVLDATAIAVPCLWDYLGAAGTTVGVFNVPFTFPARSVDGFMVSGMLTPSAAAPFAWPETLAERIRATRPDYPFDLAVDPDIDSGRAETARRLGGELAAKTALLDELLDEYDPRFLMAVLVAPDRVQHLWGKALLPGGARLDPRLEEEVLGIFSRLDAALASWAARLGPGGLLLIASDHGFAGMEKTFYLNNWLVEKGYLVLKSAGRGISGLAGRLNRPRLKRLVPRSWLGRFRRYQSGDLVDWGKTRAYASPGMEEGIYLNLAGREPSGTVLPGSDAERLAGEIREGLLGIAPPVFQDVIPRGDVYRGECLRYAPDLLLDFAFPGWNMSSSLTGGETTRDFGGKPFGVHHPDGIWIARGEGVAPAASGDASIEDVAFTVLNRLGVAAPGTLEGRMLPHLSPRGAVAPAPEPPSVPPPVPWDGDEADREEVRKRLEGLGYI